LDFHRKWDDYSQRLKRHQQEANSQLKPEQGVTHAVNCFGLSLRNTTTVVTTSVVMPSSALKDLLVQLLAMMASASISQPTKMR
jgi:predicted restriction endonuclease